MQKSVLVLVAVCGCAQGDVYDPPAAYYSTAAGLTGAALKSELHNIIDNHTVRSYDDARIILQDLDEAPGNPDYIVLIYTGQWLDVSAINPGGPIPGWDAGVSWNREHCWPRSFGIDTSGPDNSDLFNLRPCNSSINSSRGNKPYGTPHGATYWDPNALGGADRGRLARAMFYMDTRYDGSDVNTTDLTLVNGVGNAGASQFGDLSKLLEWNYSMPIDERERRRNDLIGDFYQFNRNPFVDHPEYVWAIWGTSPNDSQLSIGIPAGDGSSGATIDLGSFIAGTTPPTTSVTLSKVGATPTTYDIAANGDAQSSDALPRQTFVFGSGTRFVEVGVSGSAVPASLSGTIVVDNTDLTSSGAGRGSGDGDDVVTVTAEALAHSDGSFDPVINDNTQTVNFGTIWPSADQSVTIWNLESTPGLTSDLIITGVSGTGDTSRLTVDLVPPAQVAPGMGAMFLSSFDAVGGSGTYRATYTFTVADESIPGATSGSSLVLTLQGTAALCVADLTTQGAPLGDPGYGVPDGLVSSTDLNFYVNAYVAGDPVIADLTTQGAPQGDPNYGVPDGLVSGSDLNYYVNAYVAGCP